MKLSFQKESGVRSKPNYALEYIYKCIEVAFKYMLCLLQWS